ncbi:MAG TPA: dTDP-4-dehydrorhamnose 3,5-epimerase [Longimicrobiaceae bacterium]|nr:dTDP-4-dehydrorhamnose 3,5-epimerase [Longimicrobiaceae bacterium]
MKVIPTRIPEVLLLELASFPDERGFFMETWNRERYEIPGMPDNFVQDNVSRSGRGVLRGLHFQSPNGQGKLVTALVGSVFDVAVDLRRDSSTFRSWVGVDLSADNHRQMYVPEGFAHGFVVTSDAALVSYKCTRSYSPEHERILRWSDPEVAVDWPVAEPILSLKDAAAPLLSEIDDGLLFHR